MLKSGLWVSQLTYRVATKNFPENRLQGFVVPVNVI